MPLYDAVSDGRRHYLVSYNKEDSSNPLICIFMDEARFIGASASAYPDNLDLHVPLGIHVTVCQAEIFDIIIHYYSLLKKLTGQTYKEFQRQ